MNENLIVIASKQEFNALFPNVSAVVAASTPVSINSQYDVTMCGVGVVEFGANLSYLLSQRHYKRAFLLGICGAYANQNLEVGEVVRVDSEVMGDIGVQNQDGHFTPWREVSGEENIYTAASPRILPITLAALPSVAGVTVSCCTGTLYLALRRSGMFNANVESMEGVAFFAACKRFKVEAFEFRAISNIASDRDLSAWKIPEALHNLKTLVLDELK